MIKSHISHTVICPSCNIDTGSTVDHLKDYAVKWSTSWYCDECGVRYTITKVGANATEWEVKSCNEHKVKLAVYLKHGDMCIVVQGMTFKKVHEDMNWEEVFSQKQYFYEEHTCPSNIAGQAVISTSTGDNDPHGIFELIAIESWDNAMSQCNYDWKIPTEGWPDEKVLHKN